MFKPLLAHKIHSIEDAFFPCLCTPKIDGFRCYKLGGRAYTRSGKPIPNLYVRSMIETAIPDGCDGELTIIGGGFNDAQRLLRREGGEPAFQYTIFDHVYTLTEPYYRRIERLKKLWLPSFAVALLPDLTTTPEELSVYEALTLATGYEGVMLRAPTSPYKCGRSTHKEQILVALKRFEDAEAEVVGFIEQKENTNTAFESELGFTKRSTHQEGMKGKSTLGAFIVKDLQTGVEFKIGGGIGLTHDL